MTGLFSSQCQFILGKNSVFSIFNKRAFYSMRLNALTINISARFSKLFRMKRGKELSGLNIVNEI